MWPIVSEISQGTKVGDLYSSKFDFHWPKSRLTKNRLRLSLTISIPLFTTYQNNLPLRLNQTTSLLPNFLNFPLKFGKNCRLPLHQRNSNKPLVHPKQVKHQALMISLYNATNFFFPLSPLIQCSYLMCLVQRQSTHRKPYKLMSSSSSKNPTSCSSYRPISLLKN